MFQRRSLNLSAAIAGLVAIALLAGGAHVLRQQKLQRSASAALESLDRGGDLLLVEKAIEDLDADPAFEADVRLLRGAVLLQQGEQSQALQLLGSVPAEGRLRLPRLILAGQILQRMGRFSDAQRVFRQLADEFPRAVSPHRGLASIYHELGAMSASLRELEAVARLQPEGFFAYRLMGLLHREDFGMHKEAVEDYRKALERHPPREHAQMIRREMAQSLLHLNDYIGVLDVLAEAQDDARVLALRAECRWSQGAIEEARELIAKALELDPRESMALALGARMALDAGQPEKAVAPLQQLLEIDPHDVDARYQLSRVYQRMGETEAAQAELEKMNKSKALREQLERMSEQARVRSQDADIREEIARLCDELGKPELAQVWRRAAEQCRQPGGLLGLDQ